MINGGGGTKGSRKVSEQTSAQTGPWTVQQPLGSPGSRHGPPPAPRPFWIPFQFHLHQPSARNISSCMSQTVSPQRGSSPTQVPMDFAATSGTTATWKLLLGKVTWPPSLNGSGPLGNCAIVSVQHHCHLLSPHQLQGRAHTKCHLPA